MYLLLTAATPEEIQPAIDFFEKKKYNLLHLELLITGIGTVATTYSLTKSITQCRPAIIIQAGIAGCFTPGNETKIFVVSEDRFGDLGVWNNEIFTSVFDLNLSNKNKMPYTDGVLKNPYQKLIYLSGIKAIRSITVNEITTQANKILWYKQNDPVELESMEGAALHYVCLQEQIPFLQLRSVSNVIGERDKTKWKTDVAIKNLNQQLISLINTLSEYDETFFRI